MPTQRTLCGMSGRLDASPPGAASVKRKTVVVRLKCQLLLDTLHDHPCTVACQTALTPQP